MNNKKNKNRLYHLRVFGCQMNKSDAERIDAVMEKAGYSQTSDEKLADVIIAVMCSVRQSAVDRIYGLSGRWRKLNAKKISTGCILDFDKKKLRERFDVILPITEIEKLPELIVDHRPLTINDANRCKYLNTPALHKSKFQAYVPIMTGCESYCTYCVVPYVRGKEVSRVKKDVVDEVKNLIKDGYKEITLLGENVNNYPDFPDLLKTLTKIPDEFWMRFVTSNPENFSDELIGVVADEPKICNYLHIPFQAGGDRVLKKMNRKYTKSEYLKLIKRIKKAIPDVALSTDVIVGFPGETNKDFGETAEVMRRVKFDMAYIAQYSPRPGTAAGRMTDDVTREEKKRREKVLTGVLEDTALANNRRLIGKTLEVLACDEKKLVTSKLETRTANTTLMGKTEGFKNVRFEGNEKMIGEFVEVKITKASAWGLEGEFVK